MRRLLSTLAQHSVARRAAMSMPGVRNLAWRFVAGESLDAGLDAVRALHARGIKATLNYVGTHVRDRTEAVAAADAAIESLQGMREAKLDPNVSIKLSHIGLDVDEATCRTQLRRILDCARPLGGFVRIDMEESPYTDRTISLFEEMRGHYDDTVGIVLQSYLRRNRADVARLAAAGSRIRLCKGGYWESSPGAYRSKADVDGAFRTDLELLLRRGRHPAIATHDPVAIGEARRVAHEAGLARSGFEFQMLYGVRADLQAELVREGYGVRCYVPYGGRWYEYVLGCIRRLPGGAIRRFAERFPAGGVP
jgi:proline dehydrogenase